MYFVTDTNKPQSEFNNCTVYSPAGERTVIYVQEKWHVLTNGILCKPSAHCQLLVIFMH